MEKKDEIDETIEVINKIIKILNESDTCLNNQYTAIQRIRLHLEEHMKQEILLGVEEKNG